MLQTTNKLSKTYRNKQIVANYNKLIKKPEAMKTAVVQNIAEDFGLNPSTVYKVLGQVR